MQTLKIVPVPTAVAETVRSTMKAPVYGFPAWTAPQSCSSFLKTWA